MLHGLVKLHSTLNSFRYFFRYAALTGAVHADRLVEQKTMQE